MKLRSAVLFYSSGYDPPPARPTVLETDTSALPIQSFLPMSRIPSGDQQQLPLMRSSLSPGAQVMHTPSSNTLKNLHSHQSIIIGKFELGPTSVREFGPTASLNDRFAPEGAIHNRRNSDSCFSPDCVAKVEIPKRSKSPRATPAPHCWIV
jgi:hypothetical protein